MTRRVSLLPLLAALMLVFAPVRGADAPAPPPSPAGQPTTSAAITSTIAQAVSSAVPPFTLEEAVARALDKNFDLQIQRLSVQSANDSVIIADAAYNPTLTASSTVAGSRAAALGAVTPGSQADSLSPRVGVSQKISSGATFGVSAGVDRSVSAFSTNPYGGVLSLNVRQPLLQGAGVAVNRAAQDRARLGVKLAGANFKSSVLSIVHDVEFAYYALVFAREQLGVRQFALEVALRLLDENRARRAAGVAIDLDVLQAEVGVANARLTVISAEQSVHDREDALLQLISRFNFDAPIGPVSLGDDSAAQVTLAGSYALARSSQPDLLAAAISLGQLRLDVLTADNARHPQLDLGGSLGLSSRENNYGDATSQLLTGRGESWSLGLNLTLPWGLRAENARYRQSVASLDSEQARYEQLDQSLLAQVRTAVRAVQTGRESVAIAALASSLSQRQYDQEKARYDAGLATFRDVQNFQADANNARISELQARVSLRQAEADLARLEASSLPHYKIKLAE